MKSSPDSQRKKNNGQILGYISFCFEMRAYLGQLFA